MIAAAGTNGVLRLAQRGERLRAIAQAHSGAVRHVVFIDNSALATIGEDRWVKTWSTDLQVRHAWQFGPECRLWIDNVAPDLKLFVADANGLPRRAFEMTDGRLVATLNSDGRTITGLAVSPDHRTLAISDDTGAVDLWDTRRWTLRARLRGHLTGVGHVAFSPDGRRLATGGSAMEAVKLWDAETLQQLCDLPVQSGYTTQLSFSSDGRSLAFNPTLYLHRSLQILLAPHP
jgi:WD40 repeat protein